MKNVFMKIGRYIQILLPLAAIVIGCIVMSVMPPSVQQASEPVPQALQFEGQYSRDGQSWYPLDSSKALSSFDGDLYLRGHFSDTVFAGSRLYYFSDHIGEELYIGDTLYASDILMEIEQLGMQIQPVMCERGWSYWYFEDTLMPQTQVTIHLTNPHRFGNGRAYMDFMQTLYVTANEPDYLNAALRHYSAPGISAGMIIVIIAVIFLCIAIAGLVLQTSGSLSLVKLGLLAGFAGCYFIFDTVNFSLWSEMHLLNTYGRQISMMYAVHFLGVAAKDMMTGKRRTAASAALLVSAFFHGAVILLSMGGYCLIFDTFFAWVIMQLVFCPVFAVCCVLELFSCDKHQKMTMILLSLQFGCILLDMTGLFTSIYSQGSLSKCVFLLMFLYIVMCVARRILVAHKASVRAEKLEKELEESRIAVMLSQIQPHFLFNVLGTLRGLCREDPEQAWQGLGDFSVYLRGNMSALTNAKFIRFETELRHVETYLRLEKMRLGDKLSIVYDIQEKNFSIPPLTLQPLVENAVKHGVFYKQSGGIVTIHSRMENHHIILSVHDNGVGFQVRDDDFGQASDQQVGLTNVRNRVEKMMNGTLLIESEPHIGTTVTVTFPVENR